MLKKLQLSSPLEKDVKKKDQSVSKCQLFRKLLWFEIAGDNQSLETVEGISSTMTITSVIVGTVVTQVVGAFWYNVFAEPWMRGLGKKREDFKNTDSSPFLLAFLAMFALSAFMSATLRPFFGVVTVEEAIHFALRVSVAGALLQIPHRSFQGTGWSTYFVNVGYDAVCLLIICVITTML
ncbi:uncharacterized protein LOC110988999 isoform X2 [Acanthaster planci]|uniref:Uncharacterized protein LOC110988999 isoform X2 n=1 Tax=Acanthaster planci TaxID=133434 RepID=A0A8B7ZUI6_ACAPL|nr:uncharacterized protein LOC110988999 isoform X2 [Acanthaster planci]